MVWVSDYAYYLLLDHTFNIMFIALATFLNSTAGYITLFSLFVFVLYTSINFFAVTIVCTNKEGKGIIEWMFSCLAQTKP